MSMVPPPTMSSSSPSSASLFERLPKECHNHIFQYLPLHDLCCGCSTVSRTTLEYEVIPEIKRRRFQQFLTRHEEYVEQIETSDGPKLVCTNVRPTHSRSSSRSGGNDDDDDRHERRISADKTKTKTKTGDRSSSSSVGESDTTTTTTTNETNYPFLHSLKVSSDNNNSSNNNKKKSGQWNLLPSVFERIEHLHRSIPSSHALNGEVRCLKVDLERVRREVKTEINNNINNNKIKNDSNNDNDDDNVNASQKKESDSETVAVGNSSSSSSNHKKKTIQELLDMLKDATRAHQLHSSLLRRCTVGLDPQPSSLTLYNHYNHQTTPGAVSHRRNDLTVLLDEYMGDVVACYYLSAHSLAGIVEGGPTITEWVGNQLAPMVERTSEKYKKRNSKPYDWYKLWVFLHSNLLRNIPLTLEQAEQRVRLGPLAGIMFETIQVRNDLTLRQVDNIDGHNQDNMQQNRNATGIEANRGARLDGANSPPTRKVTHWFRPPLCFSTGIVDQAQIVHNNASPAVDYINQIFGSNMRDPVNVGMHQTTMNHFGPLGPAFRGRDNVTTQTMSPYTLIGLLANHSRLLLMDPYFGLNSNQRSGDNVSRFGRFLSDNDALLKWLTDLRHESSRVRPMTVLPPLVTIRVSEL